MKQLFSVFIVRQVKINLKFLIYLTKNTIFTFLIPTLVFLKFIRERLKKKRLGFYNFVQYGIIQIKNNVFYKTNYKMSLII